MDTLSHLSLLARRRKMAAISHMLIEDWKPFPVDKSYDANIAKTYGRSTNA